MSGRGAEGGVGRLNSAPRHMGDGGIMMAGPCEEQEFGNSVTPVPNKPLTISSPRSGVLADHVDLSF